MNLTRKSLKLGPAFYERDDVVTIAQELLGKIIVTRIDGQLTSGRIVETEAYEGITDRASHAYGGRRTPRTEIMFKKGGTAYVYLCYGIHHLFNVVTHMKGVPHAVLIRAIEPLQGKGTMLSRMGKKSWDSSIGSGPGNLSRALGILTRHSGMSLQGAGIYIADDGYETGGNILVTPRIGVDYAGKDASLPYRFLIAGHPNASAKSFTKKYFTH